MKVVKERTIEGNTYFIRAFPAFAAANLAGELASLITPAIGSVISLLGGKSESDNLFDMDAEKAAPLLADALSRFDGDTVERMIKKLLIKQGNISVQQPTDTEAQLLTEELADELFCGDVMNMFVLAYEVIQANFPDIFRKVQNLFGNRAEDLREMLPTLANTEL